MKKAEGQNLKLFQLTDSNPLWNSADSIDASMLRTFKKYNFKILKKSDNNKISIEELNH